MSIRLVVDYRMCRASGIGVYLRTVVRQLLDHHPDFRVSLIGGDEVPGVVAHYPCRSPIYSLSELVELPLRAPRSADIFWSPNYNAPLVSPGRLVVTVHDANHLAMPHLLDSRLKRAYARVMFRNVSRRASRVIAVSQFTADELVKHAGIDPGRIRVIHSGIGAEWRKTAPTVRRIADPYLLFVGNVKPHKNLGRLLQAFDTLADRIPQTLVVVGKREGFLTPDRDLLARAAALGSRVVFTGEVASDDLRGYYEHADLLVYPSLYEGFGFPPLEAMALGVPVAASRTASIPEVCGDAAAYFDPLSIEDMARVIEMTLRDEDLRQRLRQTGREQSRRYAWPVTTARIADVFREVALGA